MSFRRLLPPLPRLPFRAASPTDPLVARGPLVSWPSPVGSLLEMLQGEEGAGRGTCWRLWRSLDLLGDKERKAQDSTDPWLSQASLLSPSSSPAWNAPLVLSPPGLGLRHGTEQASRAEDFPCGFFPHPFVSTHVMLSSFHFTPRSGLGSSTILMCAWCCLSLQSPTVTRAEAEGQCLVPPRAAS